MQAPGDGEEQASDDELRVDVTGSEGVCDVGLVHRERTHDEGRSGRDRVERRWHRLSKAEDVGGRVVGRGRHARDGRSDAARRGDDTSGPADSTNLRRGGNRTQSSADGGGDERHGWQVDEGVRWEGRGENGRRVVERACDGEKSR